MKRKMNYEQPQSVVTRVELESPICSGSAVIENPGDEGFKIENQMVNDSFDFTGDMGNWDSNKQS